MKRLVFFVCGVFLLEGFAFELSMSQNFVQKLEPSVMQISFTLSTKASSAEAIRERLHPIITEMKKSTICSGGAYAISPEYKYEKEKARVLVGFYGKVNYKCSFEETTQLDGVVALLDAKKKIELTQSPVRWVVKQEKIQEAQRALELEALQHPMLYAKSLQEQKIAKCKVQKVSLHKNIHIPFVANVTRAMSTSIPEPTKETQEIQISAEYLYECEEF